MLAVLVLLLCFSPSLRAQTDSSYAFIVAGHAYGAHGGENLGLHPPFLNSLDAGYDSTAAFIVLTGDIVNHSTPESWQQVENELDSIGLAYYYVMGNHGDNDIGWQVFEDKFGGTYYSFYWQKELFVVLNSTEGDRSISPGQLEFLNDQIVQVGDSTRNIFIFFHEVIWNSDEKYVGVKSNSRSRYDQVVAYSNYWEDLHPMLTGKSEKNFYVISGDVGGNPDAISAFYDQRDNVMLLSSGMGEVVDENYLLIRVHAPDSIETLLVPLDSELVLQDIAYYSVPPAPDSVMGPANIPQGGSAIEYAVPEVFNADTYMWDLPDGAAGASSTRQVLLDFDMDFREGQLSVRAAREGFGTGPAASITVRADSIPDHLMEQDAGMLSTSLLDAGHSLIIGIHAPGGEPCFIQVFDMGGRTIHTQSTTGHAGYTEIRISKSELPAGIIFLSASSRSHHLFKKIAVRL